MKGVRNKIAYNSGLYQFLFEIYVVCPTCQGKAFVKSPPYPVPKKDENQISITCTNCGYNRLLSEKPDHYAFRSSRKVYTGKYIMLGAPVDPYFHLPLWLSIPCCNNLLWAYNYEHIDFLRNFISAELRERNGQPKSNHSIGSRLPRWITAANNRKDVLKCIEKLMLK